MRKCFTSKKTVFNQTTLGPQSTKDWFSTSPNKNEVPENHFAEKTGDWQKSHVFPECGKSVKKAIASNST